MPLTIGQVDKDNSGRLSLDAFMQLMANKMAEKDTKEEIMKVYHQRQHQEKKLMWERIIENLSDQAFKLFDDDETGQITFTNLRRVAKELGENLTDEELQVSF